MDRSTTITSRDNTKLKLARRVRDGRENELMFVEGMRLCSEAVNLGQPLVDCFVTESFVERFGDEIPDSAAKAGGNVSILSERLLESIADTPSPQGIVIISRRPSADRQNLTRSFDSNTAVLPTVLLLHEISNPSNLGAILRVAEAAGSPGVIISSNSADVFSARSVRASMGSVFRVPIWADASVDDVREWASARDLTLTAADIAGERSYSEIDWQKPRMLVFGSEAHGLPDHEKQKVRELVTIPMAGKVESLNLAVSVGVILFEAKRQNSGSK